jgi:mono/diheme cytochrome c family protein
MSSFPELRRALTLLAAVLMRRPPCWPRPTAYPGIGRAATPKEVAAWDIDVRPDFKGLPKGSGSVAQGQDLWEAKCASCHGIFGESQRSLHAAGGRHHGRRRQDRPRGAPERRPSRAAPR